jgi:HTH-type transcriptional regulator/antitoxin HigA
MSDGSTFQPRWSSSPGETIIDVLQERKLSVAELARKMRQPLVEIESLVDGRLAITIGIARDLQKILGASVEFWMTRDLQYREDTKRLQAAEASQWLADLPISDMLRFKWIDSPKPSEEFEACLNFFGVRNLRTWHEQYSQVESAILFRTARKLDSKVGAIAAWLRRGVIETEFVQCEPFSSDRLASSLPLIRQLTRTKDPQAFVPQLVSIFAKCGVRLAIVRAPNGCRASGATWLINPNQALLLLSSRYLSDDQFWFTVFHEIGHLVLHTHRELILEGVDASSEVEENQANSFAEHAIVPAEYRSAFNSLRSNTDQVVRFARRLGVAPGLVVGQMQFHRLIGANQLNGLKRRYQWDSNALISRERL